MPMTCAIGFGGEFAESIPEIFASNPGQLRVVVRAAAGQRLARWWGGAGSCPCSRPSYRRLASAWLMCDGQSPSTLEEGDSI